MKMKNRNTVFIVFLVFFLVGIGLMVGGVMLYLDEVNFRETAKETTATITNIETYRDSDDDTQHTVYVEYSVKGKVYEGTLNYYTSGMRKGGSVKIYYDPTNPDNFRGGPESAPLYILGGLGLVFFLIGGISLFVQFKRKSLKKRLIASGTKIYAIMTGMVPGNVRVNGQVCMHMICEYTDTQTGTLYRFKSDGIWVAIPQMPGAAAHVPVYVDYNDYTKYYVDVEGYLESLPMTNIVDLT